MLISIGLYMFNFVCAARLAICRFALVIKSKAKYILIQSFIYANFNYCPLIWHFSSSKSLQKIESIQKRALRFLYGDYESDYETLLTKAGKTTMNVYRLNVLCTEIYKSLNSFNPVFIKDIFKPNTSSRSLRAQQQHNLKTPSPKTKQLLEQKV